jgi:hypothetical protein
VHVLRFLTEGYKGEVRPNMAKKKKEDVTRASDTVMEISLDSTLLDKLQKISEATGLSNQELFQKWITQEESVLHVLEYYVDQQNKAPQPVEKPQRKSSPVHEELEESTESDKTQDYRKTLLQKILALKKQRMPLTKIAAQFNEEGIATISGSGKWYSSTISYILSTN